MEKNSIYNVELKEQSKLYWGVFRDYYKSHKRFNVRRRIYLIVAGVFYLLTIWVGYKDFGWDFLQKTDFFIRRFIEIVMVFYILWLLNIRLDIGELYIRYWKMRKILYENGTYVDGVRFSFDGIQIQRCEERKEVTDYIQYSQIRKIKFYRNGMVIQPYEKSDSIYVSKDQFKNKKDFRMVRTWCLQIRG